MYFFMQNIFSGGGGFKFRFTRKINLVHIKYSVF